MNVLRVQDLAAGYLKRRIFTEVSFDANAGEFIGIAGLNGSGKSTLLKTLQRLLPIAEGTILINRHPLQSYSFRNLAKLIAVVPQRITISFQFTARQLVALGRTPYLGFLAQPSSRDRAVVEAAMEKTDCLQFAETFISELSSGELQRVCIATALAQETQVLLLDEPTNALDLRQQSRLLKLLNSLKSDGKTILFATHDLSILQRSADRVLLLHERTQHAFDSPDMVFNRQTLSNVFELESETLYVG